MSEDYSQGKIYKLTAGDRTYYGSTIETLNDRFSKHKSDAKRNICVTSKKLFDSSNDVKIELVEDYPCETKKQLKEREGYYQLNFECVNKLIAGRTGKQYYDDNREHRLDKMKEYREKNKQIIAEKMKEYREKNKQIIAEKMKEYNRNNREKINARASEKIQCECGAVVCKSGIARHRKSQQHKRIMENKNL